MTNDFPMSESAHISPFEAIRRANEHGVEYWSARELARILGYTQYNKFVPVLEKAEEACRHSDMSVEDHFTHTSEMVGIGSGARRKFDTVYLSRYACYLLVQNADSSKPIVALGQTRQKLEREQIQANRTHHEMGRKVREFIQDVGSTLPEDLPTPDESIQQLQAKERQQFLAQQQPSLFKSEKNEGDL